MATRRVTTLPVTELPVANGHWNADRLPIDRVIIHTMVGTIASANARFNASDNQSSAHYGVGLDGSIVHWADEIFNAFHAGNYPMNQRSIGIEHEDGWNGQPPEPTRPDALYATSARLVRDICQFYGIPIDREHIRMHKEVCDPPGTACPDALDIERIVREAATATQHVRVTVDMWLRALPRADSNRLVECKPGEVFPIAGAPTPHWTRVQAHGQNGWLLTSNTAPA